MNDAAHSEDPAPGPDPGPSTPSEPAARRRFWTRGVSLLLFVLTLILAAVMVSTLPDDSAPAVEVWQRDDDPRAFVAVMPFKNFCDDKPKFQPLADALADQLITRLRRVHPARLGVIARDSVMPYGESPPSLTKLGEQLQVRFAAESSVRVSGTRVRVEVRLVDCRAGLILWSTGEWRDYRDILELLDQAAVQLAQQLRIERDPALPAVAAAAGTRRDVAAAAYFDGLGALADRRPEQRRAGIQQLRDALEEDPQFALAWAALAEACARQGAQALAAAGTGDLGEADRAWFDEAEAAAEQALSLHEASPAAWFALALVRQFRDGDATGAEAAFQEVLALDPAHASAHRAYAALLSAGSRHEDALQHLRAAMQLDPRSPWVRAELAQASLDAGQTEEAGIEAQRSLLLEPGFEPALAVQRQLRPSEEEDEGAPDQG